MIDHIGFPVSDYERSKAFYLKALAPLDYTLVMEVTQEEHGHDPAAGFGANGKPDFWIGGEGGLDKPLHVAIVAKDRATVDAFYRRPWPPADATTARREFARTITRTITAPSCSTPTATTSKPSATRRRSRPAGSIWIAREPRAVVTVVAPGAKTSGDAMPIEPPEIPPATPGQPTEPPPESPPGNPRPEVPPPIHEPGQPPQPEELPGKTPEELPTRGPNGPRTPNPATDQGAE